MPNLIEVNYEQTGESKSTNEFGMRAMQQKAYEQRDARYLLLKAPPASGKSRALMFIALDKLRNQGLKKAIVAVPERAIGGSFGNTDLKSLGFFANWEIDDKYNLCTSEDNKSKVEAFKEFLSSSESILICTHSTLRFAFEELKEDKFNDVLVAIDEFHHVSADGENRLGEVLRSLIEKSTCHIVAMTGSYFRGDSVPVLLPEDEAKFIKVTYNYYEQLNGYEYLKSLGIGYHFYQGRYTSALDEILDTNKKTILHIPNVNSGESTKDKYKEVGIILDIIGEVKEITTDGIIILKRHSDGKLLKVADLVNDDKRQRDKIVKYLRGIKSVDDMDLIIALGMAKEGFDWPYCEHALTVGYRSSLTEIIQIIGRATRDSENKTTAQFTNLIAQPDAHNDDVKLSVNNMLKAITASLLMEQVLAPSFKFKPRFLNDDEPPKKGELKIRGFKKIASKKVEDIIQSDLNDLKASILQDEQMLKAMPGNIEPEVINKVLIPKIIRKKYPELDDSEVDELSQYVVVDSVIRNAEIKTEGGKKFIKMADKFVNIDDLNIDLINSINPFQRAFEILSKQVTTTVLKLIQDSIEATRIDMDFEEASILWPKIQVVTNDDRLIASFEEINNFFEKHNRLPQKCEDMKERGLFSRLQGINESPNKIEALKQYDRHNLLKSFEINSIDDILNNDTFGIFSNDDNEDIFVLKNIPKVEKRAGADFIARREVCEDFYKYQQLFVDVHNDLKEGKRRLSNFRSEKDIEKGFYFVLNGVVGYVVNVGDEFTINKSRNKNTRLEIVFENETKSNMLLRSLSVALYKDGKIITQHNDKLLDKLLTNTNEDKQSGYIYVLKSLSSKDEIATKKDLYKIGFSTTSVEKRVKNAINEPTYLMADVKIVAIYEVFNVNPHKLEQLIHKFFANSCLDIEIYDKYGKIYKPKEWFIVPIRIIDEVIELIISEEIILYKYDYENETIVKK